MDLRIRPGFLDLGPWWARINFELQGNLICLDGYFYPTQRNFYIDRRNNWSFLEVLK